jgi:hypothetical protein
MSRRAYQRPNVSDSHPPNEYPGEPHDALFNERVAAVGRPSDLAPEEVWDVHDE